MKSINHKLVIEAQIEKIYESLTTQKGLAGWWTAKTKAKPEIGSTIRFEFEPDYVKEMKIEELQTNSKVKWLCVGAYEEWIGTTISFELRPHKRGTSLTFYHDGWKDSAETYTGCNYDWAIFLRSLKLLCETGKGLPYPNHYK
ncbi:SRPBCC domain-containing protein [Sinomicrobium pectinilyticum]|uniref:SRPBCC domain-containing protein n=1 Tax=Sinomicrobium pectinilyticum TaxID=1084421 RepID=A0A3N0ER92_SINP1|nr:SRPBCC domain-containing protein [Sinomicrobium pectinilyticum]RNL90396.1 SRPBCC domain-containing protein [Sinomicrobium pectinilyticum]